MGRIQSEYRDRGVVGAWVQAWNEDGQAGRRRQVGELGRGREWPTSGSTSGQGKPNKQGRVSNRGGRTVRLSSVTGA